MILNFVIAICNCLRVVSTLPSVSTWISSLLIYSLAMVDLVSVQFCTCLMKLLRCILQFILELGTFMLAASSSKVAEPGANYLFYVAFDLLNRSGVFTTYVYLNTAKLIKRIKLF